MNISTKTSTPTNPLLQTWNTPYGLPPFERVEAAHFAPAFQYAMSAHTAELNAIALSASEPDFDNTVRSFDASGRLLNRISLLFQNLTVSETSAALQSVQIEIAPSLAAHENAVYMNAALFRRIDGLHKNRASLKLSAEELRLLERVHLDFVRAGALLPESQRQRYGEVMTALATLCTRFSQNVLAEEAAFSLPLHNASDFAGLPDFVRAAAAHAAAQRGLPGVSHVITLSP